VSATSMVGDDLVEVDVFAGTTIYGLFTAVSVSLGEVTAYLAGRTDIDDVWAYIRAYGIANGAVIEGEDCAKAAISPLLDKYYAQASLVMVPSLYKTSIVYSERPLSTDGQLTFTRNSNATRVNADGLVEKVRTNLLKYSQDFGNAIWQSYASGTASVPSVIINNAIAPDGTLTADTIVFNTGAGTTVSDRSVIYQDVTISADTYTTSFYARVTSGTAQLLFRGVAGAAYTTANLTTTWQRFNSVEVGLAGTKNMEIGLRRGLVNEPINSSVTVEIWGAMMEVSDFGATDYIPTTTSARSTFAGITVDGTSVPNVPRLDYSGGASCPSLLLEPQRTNVHTLSESMYQMLQFSLSGAVNPTNARSVSTVSPSGYYNAAEVTGGNSSTGSWGIYNLIPTSISAGNQISVSTFAKSGTHDIISLSQANISFTGTGGAYFDLSNGTTPTAGARMEYYGNGWWRCFMPIVTLTANSPASYNIGHYVAPSTSSNIWSTNYNGKSVYFFGTQVEAGSYASSYIPTLSTAVTRLVDACSKTGISSLIGQTEGTVFVEFPFNSKRGMAFQIATSNGYENAIYLERTSDSSMAVQCWVGGVQQVSILLSGMVDGQVYKVAVAYKANDFAVYKDGTLVNTDTSASLPASINNLYVGNYGGSAGDELPINQLLLFKTRLTNAQMAELTTL